VKDMHREKVRRREETTMNFVSVKTSESGGTSI